MLSIQAVEQDFQQLLAAGPPTAPKAVLFGQRQYKR
jgi:hypothetical protein